MQRCAGERLRDRRLGAEVVAAAGLHVGIQRKVFLQAHRQRDGIAQRAFNVASSPVVGRGSRCRSPRRGDVVRAGKRDVEVRAAAVRPDVSVVRPLYLPASLRGETVRDAFNKGEKIGRAFVGAGKKLHWWNLRQKVRPSVPSWFKVDGVALECAAPGIGSVKIASGARTAEAAHQAGDRFKAESPFIEFHIFLFGWWSKQARRWRNGSGSSRLPHRRKAPSRPQSGWDFGLEFCCLSTCSGATLRFCSMWKYQSRRPNTGDFGRGALI